MVRLIQQQSPVGTDLLAQYRASGAPEVFAQIMRAYGGMVFSVCLKVTRDAADAEDASQATFLTLAVQCKTGATITYLGPWLKKVAKRSSLDLVRSRKRRTRRESITAENRPEHYRVHPSAGSEHAELSQIIRAELDELPAKYRMPLVLHYFGGMSHDQISREMQCTTAALGVRLHRARKMLGKRLTARGISLEGAALGTAIAVAINYVVNERFIENTTNAMLAMSGGRPLFGMTAQAMAAHVAGTHAMGSHLPASLGLVPQLVQEVAQSMARTRMRMATLALGISVTMLGGAAEAVRHLPDSIRPSLEFLAPSKVIGDFFRFTPSLPRVELRAPVTTPSTPVQPMAQAESDDYTTPPIPTLPLRPPVQRQPVMAMEFATPAPPIVTRSHTPTVPQRTVSAPPTVEPPRAPTVTHLNAGMPVLAGETPHNGAPAASSSAGPVRISAAGSDQPSTASAISIKPVSSSDSQNQSLSQFVPPPKAFGNESANLEKTTSLRTLAAATATATGSLAGASGLIAGASTGDVGPLTAEYDGAGPAPIERYELLALSLRPSDMYIAGDGSYRWSDSTDSIDLGGVNSADISLHGVASPGVLSVEHLSPNTTLAPSRPKGHTFIGIWSISDLLDYDSIDLTVRYDYVLAESLGLRESVLKLWVFRDEQWIRINDSTFSRDLGNHSLTGSTGSGIEYFAVSAPEPTSVMSVLTMGALALLRRRRRN